MRAWPRILLVVVAVGAALAPVPAEWIDRRYTGSVYAGLQPALTSASNLVSFALLDVALVVLLALLISTVTLEARRWGALAAVKRLLLWLVTTAAVIYLLFLATWGLNYRRVPLEARLDFDRQRISADAAVRLAGVAIAEVNRGYDAAHAQPFDPARLEASLAGVRRELGAVYPVVPATPKRSLLQYYFRRAAIDGMTVPVFLEVILHPDLVPVERPFVLAHEGAHIAGFADESEANFVALLACIRSDDPVARYSGWLDAYRYATQAVPRERRAGLPRLEPGPRDDLRQISARLGRSSPVIRMAARDVYDSYLKANRIEEGIDNYGRVLQLVLGTRFGEGWRPLLRTTPHPVR